nr:benzoate/H(+) symporter BenE family transporter [Desulfitobacterium hafniense]
MARLLEKPYKVGESLKELTQNLSFPGLTTGLIGATFSASVGLGIIISVAKDGKLPDALAISWIFAVFLFGGLATTVISTLYRTPVVIAWSIPGAVLIGKYLTSGGTIYQAAGTYIVIAIVVLILTATGAIKKLIDHIPVPIMLGMVGGVLLSYGIGAFANGMKVPAVYGVMVLVFFVWQFFRSLSSKIPSVVVAAIVGIIMLKVMGMTKSVPITWAIASPVFITPQFSLSSLLTLGVPLFFMVVGVQNIQAIGVLLSLYGK